MFHRKTKTRLSRRLWRILLSAGLLLVGLGLPAHSARATMPVPVHEFPSALLLCGEKVPLERQDVWEMMDQAFVLSV